MKNEDLNTLLSWNTMNTGSVLVFFEFLFVFYKTHNSLALVICLVFFILSIVTRIVYKTKRRHFPENFLYEHE